MRLFRVKYDKVSDEELLALSSKGDERAFETLFDRYASRVRSYFFRMLWKDAEKAEDFTQELFIKVINNQSKFEKGKKFKPWLFSIANNMCKNAYRHQEVVGRANEEMAIHNPNHAFSKSDEQMDAAIFRDRLDEVLNEMDEEKRSTFYLRYDEELSIKEISELMACSEGTVKSRLFYTLKHLSKALGEFQHLLKQ